MRIIISVFLALFSSPFLSSGFADPVPAADRVKDIDEYVKSLGALPPLPPKPATEWRQEGSSWIRDRFTVKSFNEFVLLDPNAGVLWPGALIQGDSLRELAFTPLILSRSPLTISLTGAASANGNLHLSATIEKPSNASVADAINDLVAKIDPHTTVSQASFSISEVKTLDEALSRVGISGSYLTASARASLETSNYSARHNLVVDFAQRYFTISVDPPSDAASFLSPSTAVTDVQRLCKMGSPPLYISNVSYGRRMILIFSSASSIETLKTAVNASFNAIISSGDAQMSADTKNVLSNSELHVITIGGGAAAAIGMFTGDAVLAGMKSYFAKGAEVSLMSGGTPISFRANYLHDNKMADLQMLSVDRDIRPTRETKYFLRFFNHAEPGVIYKVVRNMEQGALGGGDFNTRYLPYVQKLPKYPGRVIKETEVAGDENFKAVPANSWTAPPMSLPSLLKRGLEVMDDERWYLVEYEEEIPKPAQ